MANWSNIDWWAVILMYKWIHTLCKIYTDTLSGTCKCRRVRGVWLPLNWIIQKNKKSPQLIGQKFLKKLLTNLIGTYTDKLVLHLNFMSNSTVDVFFGRFWYFNWLKQDWELGHFWVATIFVGMWDKALENEANLAKKKNKTNKHRTYGQPRDVGLLRAGACGSNEYL